MKEIVMNKHNLKEEDITEIVKRVKVILVNSKNEILLGYADHDYQFIGGHVEEGESLDETVNREIEEETGIELNLSSLQPFAVNYGYYKDWPKEGKNRKIEIYYFEVFTDKKPILEQTHYTQSEKENEFKLEYIPLIDVEDILNENVNIYGDKHGITKEMIELLKFYKEINNSCNLLK